MSEFPKIFLDSRPEGGQREEMGRDIKKDHRDGHKKMKKTMQWKRLSGENDLLAGNRH